MGAPRMTLEFYSSSFCGACAQARAALQEAARLVPEAAVVERNVAAEPDAAQAAGVRSTPTVLVRAADGAEAFRAEGVPTVAQVLVALAKAVT